MKQNLTELKREVMNEAISFFSQNPNPIQTGAWLNDAFDRIAIAALDAVEVKAAHNNIGLVDEIAKAWNAARDTMLTKRKEFLEV